MAITRFLLGESIILIDVIVYIQIIYGAFLITVLPWKNFPRGVLEMSGVLSYFIRHVLLTFGQKVFWVITGVQDELDRAETEGGYNRCVQVRRVIDRLRFPKVNHPRPWDFLSLHERFANPHELHSNNVTLYCVTKTHAYCVKTSSLINVYSSKVSPFMKRAQFNFADKVLVVPIQHFHRFCSSLGDPQVPVAWISNCGRCGSTLLTQVLEKVPRMRCLSEPDVTTNISLLRRSGEITESETETLLRTCVRFLCRVDPNVERIAVKVRYTCVTEVRLMQKLFPSFRHVYLYRDLGPVMRSFYKFIQRDLAVRCIERHINNWVLNSAFPPLRKYLEGLVARKSQENTSYQDHLFAVLRRGTFQGYASVIICSNLAMFKADLESGGARGIPTVHYDRLVMEPRGIVQRLFVHLDIPDEFVDRALGAFNRDSQAGDIASNIENRGEGVAMTQQDEESVNATLVAMGLPTMQDILELPGDICEEVELDE